MSDQLLKSIEEKRKPHHEVIYCHPSVETKLYEEVSTLGLGAKAVDNARVLGMEVVSLYGLQVTILSSYGDVFPVAKQYRSSASPKDL